MEVLPRLGVRGQGSGSSETGDQTPQLTFNPFAKYPWAMTPCLGSSLLEGCFRFKIITFIKKICTLISKIIY